MAEPSEQPADERSLFDLYKEWADIDPATELPTSLDARRALKADDGLTHCAKCGGHWFVGTIAFDADGQPARVLTPQRCLGCGEQRQASWPR